MRYNFETLIMLAVNGFSTKLQPNGQSKKNNDVTSSRNIITSCYVLGNFVMQYCSYGTNLSGVFLCVIFLLLTNDLFLVLSFRLVRRIS